MRAASYAAYADVHTSRGEYRARAKRWLNPLTGLVECSLEQSPDCYSRTVRGFDSETKLDAWLNQRRWRRESWKAPAVLEMGDFVL